MITWAQKLYPYMTIHLNELLHSIHLNPFYQMTTNKGIVQSSPCPHDLTKEEIKDIKWVREHAGNFIQFFLRINNWEPSDVVVNAHLEFWGRSNVVSWITPGKHYKTDHIVRIGAKLVEPTDVVK